MTAISPNVILFSTADWDHPFWTNKQHTARMMAQKGFHVLYIESLGLRQPQLKSADITRIFRRIKKFFAGVREAEERLHVYSPVVIPFHRYAWVRRLNDWILRTHLRRIQAKLKLDRPLVWTYNPMILDLARTLSPSRIVYHNVDDLSAAPGIDSAAVRTAEDHLLQAANLVFCTSRKLEQRSREVAGDRVHFFGNVVDYQHFARARSELAEPEDLRAIPHPRIGFIGALSSYKFDVPMVRDAARAMPEWHWVLIGKVGEGQPDTSMESLRDEANIHFLGPKSYTELPTYLKYFDVTTIPCPVNDYTQSMFPMKFFEYMAAGKPIVARKIDALREYGNYFYGYDEDLVERVSQALERGVCDPVASDRLAQDNTWEIRLLKMLALVEKG
jgi:glycosyltransferase involved in cell wall biosynthesis